jgi:hypothetical protein
MARMVDVRQSTPAQRAKVDASGVARLAKRQGGVLSRGQLEAAGVSSSAVSRWVDLGRLHRIHCRVYALGHTALPVEGRLHAALLYAGHGAAFSHTTAGWLWQIIDTEPTRIHLTVPGRRLSLPEVRIHHSRGMGAVHCRGFPVTTVARTLVDLGGSLDYRQVRRALAEADYLGLLDHQEIGTELARRRAGSRVLKAALRSHLPALAQTLSVLEDNFLELCEKADLPQPEVNARIGGMTVDCLWRGDRVIVELDGGAAHGGVAAMKRDRERELALRALGYTVVRYTWQQVTDRPEQVIADLRRLGLAALRVSRRRAARP